MIVKCDKCQTRFKIPDEKVSERGVKVRCTRCQHTFRVTRGDDLSASPRPVAPSIPPTAAPLSALPMATNPFARFGDLDAPSAQPGPFNGRGHPLPPPSSAPMFSGHQEDVPSEFFDQPTRVQTIPPDLLGLAPGGDGGSPGFDADSLFGELLPPSAPAAPGLGNGHGHGHTGAGENPFLTPATPQRGTLPRPSTDFEATVAAATVFPPPELPPSRPPVRRTAAAATNLQALPPPAAAPSAPDFFGGHDVAASESAVETSGGLLGDLPPADDLFGRPNATLTSQPVPLTELPAYGSDVASGPDRGMFDMPAAPPPAPASVTTSEAEPADEPTVPDGAPLKGGAPAPAVAATPVAAPVGKPTGRPQDLGMRETRVPGFLRRTAGLVANLAIASLLVVAFASIGTIYLNEGRLDLSSLSTEPLKALFQPTGTLLAVDVSNGLYETREGRALFYVRGEVENRGQKPTRVQVKVEILDGPLALTAAEVRAGRAANPEELYSVNSADALAALVSKLEAGATEVKPGERRPFLVPFFEYPPDLGEYRLKLTVTEVPLGKAASR